MGRRVETAVLDGWIDPAEAYSAWCGNSSAAFWLDGGPDATSGMSYIGLAEEVVCRFDGTVLGWLREQLRTADADTTMARSGFALGWVGWIGYEMHRETLRTGTVVEADQPSATWLRVDTALAFDHARRVVTVLSLDDVQVQRGRIRAAIARHTTPPSRASFPLTRPDYRWADSDEEYLEKIAACQRSIADGDAYQLCLTTEVEVDGAPDPVATYLALRVANPSHHGGLLRAGSTSLLSSSPEQFLAVSPNGSVETSPIKGTRKRGSTPDADVRLRNELVSSQKERAENIMIVDLMRNDLARVCRPGSVEASRLLAVESYSGVHQLVSTVRGDLRASLGAVDALEACFPAGSMTGAPKISAVGILGSLEQRARGIYSGAFGYLGLDGRMDLAMIIRSIIMDGKRCTIGAGGGITADSIACEELAEVKLKAAGLLNVLGVMSE